MEKVILYIHGKGGSHLEAEQYKKNCSDFDMIGIEYNDYLPVDCAKSNSIGL